MSGWWRHGRAALLVIAVGGLTGCGKELIEFIENGSGCSTCTACEHAYGSCASGGPACKQGYADLDADVGCETPISDVESDWTARSRWSENTAWFVINEKGFDMFAWPELVAIDGDLDCVASLDQPCDYVLVALKLAFTDFEFDHVHWLDGSATLAGPVDVTDQGDGIVVRAPLVLGFHYEQDDVEKNAVASGEAEVVIHYDAAIDRGSLRVYLVDTISFGGYLLDAMSVSGRLDAF